LENAGFTRKRQVGSHLQMERDGRVVPVPMHAGDVPQGTLRAIIREAGMTVKEFMDNLR
jgi:predicted RNA binding protein YcfA (HicA-like mRNA interferase family)